MGLLKPKNGKILIDNKNIFAEDNKKLLNKWQSSIDHIPQRIFLNNSTILKNIAFCINDDSINAKRMDLAISKACLDDYMKTINKNLKQKIGEDGKKISGGQKQRIGIARAIYSNLDLLVLDESTSALDNKTEKKIIEFLYNSSPTKTTITISHKLNSLIYCDKIIEFEKGKIKRVLSKEELKSEISQRKIN